MVATVDVGIQRLRDYGLVLGAGGGPVPGEEPGSKERMPTFKTEKDYINLSVKDQWRAMPFSGMIDTSPLTVKIATGIGLETKPALLTGSSISQEHWDLLDGYWGRVIKPSLNVSEMKKAEEYFASMVEGKSRKRKYNQTNRQVEVDSDGNEVPARKRSRAKPKAKKASAKKPPKSKDVVSSANDDSDASEEESPTQPDRRRKLPRPTMKSFNDKFNVENAQNITHPNQNEQDGFTVEGVMQSFQTLATPAQDQALMEPLKADLYNGIESEADIAEADIPTYDALVNHLHHEIDDEVGDELD